VLLFFGGGLPLVQFVDRLLEDFGMRSQVASDDLLDVAALGVGKALRRSGRRRAAKREREQGGSEQAERRHWQIPLGESRLGKTTMVRCYDCGSARSPSNCPSDRQAALR